MQYDVGQYDGLAVQLIDTYTWIMHADVTELG